MTGPSLIQRMLPFTSRPMPGAMVNRSNAMPASNSQPLNFSHFAMGMLKMTRPNARPANSAAACLQK